MLKCGGSWERWAPARQRRRAPGSAEPQLRRAKPDVVSKNLQLIAAHPIILQPIILQKNEAYPIFLPLYFSTPYFIFTPPFFTQEILFASIRAIRSLKTYKKKQEYDYL